MFVVPGGPVIWTPPIIWVFIYYCDSLLLLDFEKLLLPSDFLAFGNYLVNIVIFSLLLLLDNNLDAEYY